MSVRDHVQALHSMKTSPCIEVPLGGETVVVNGCANIKATCVLLLYLISHQIISLSEVCQPLLTLANQPCLIKKFLLTSWPWKTYGIVQSVEWLCVDRRRSHSLSSEITQMLIQTDRLADWLIDWPIGWSSECLTNLFKDLTDWFTERLIDWLIIIYCKADWFRCFPCHFSAGLFILEPSQLPGEYSAIWDTITCRGLALYNCHPCLLFGTHSHLGEVWEA